MYRHLTALALIGAAPPDAVNTPFTGAAIVSYCDYLTVTPPAGAPLPRDEAALLFSTMTIRSLSQGRASQVCGQKRGPEQGTRSHIRVHSA